MRPIVCILYDLGATRQNEPSLSVHNPGTNAAGARATLALSEISSLRRLPIWTPGSCSLCLTGFLRHVSAKNVIRPCNRRWSPSLDFRMTRATPSRRHHSRMCFPTRGILTVLGSAVAPSVTHTAMIARQNVQIHNEDGIHPNVDAATFWVLGLDFLHPAHSVSSLISKHIGTNGCSGNAAIRKACLMKVGASSLQTSQFLTSPHHGVALMLVHPFASLARGDHGSSAGGWGRLVRPR